MEEPSDPTANARRLARRELPRRFYKAVAVVPHAGGFAVTLDDRLAKTPGGKPLAVPQRALADTLAAEWALQAETIDPATMPLTRLVNAAFDRVAGDMAAVRAEIVRYAGSDLICYRAASPAGLVAAQERQWAPLVAWAAEAFGVRLRLATGVVHVAQDRHLAEAVAKAVAPLDALTLAAVNLAMTLTGSAIIALAVTKGRLAPDAAWAAAHVDEDWQISQWGADETALAVRAARRRDFDAAARVLAAQ
jgi:chaperone required for assembly of F1-ATPase